MLSKDNVINLEDYRAKGSKCFIGRDRGEYIRKESNINEIIEKYSTIKIIIPKDIYHISISFLEEFFWDVIEKLGKDEFLKKVEFISEGNYPIEKKVNDAIGNVLK